MTAELDRARLEALLQAEDVATLARDELLALCRDEPGIASFRPDGVCQIDPRNDDRIVFNSARARRPHDNRPAPAAANAAAERPCVVCRGETTGIIDHAPLSEGSTFINKNLFPILFPGAGPTEAPPGPAGLPAYGLHLLQWTSSRHDRDWHNMPQTDREVVLGRLAALERRLLFLDDPALPENAAWGDDSGTRGFVCVIKNYGHLVGGSLVHGHQQIALSSAMPRRMLDDLRFSERHGETFADHILRVTPPELLLRDYGPAALLVPYFMRRPYDMLLVLRRSRCRYLHQLTAEERAAVARGWHDAIGAMLTVMPQIGKESAYNVVTHNGPGAGLYFEFLPYTQETGGYEHLGLILCQGEPQGVAERLRELL